MRTIGIKTVNKVKDYNRALASARLRCYDLINYFRGDPDLLVELYNSEKCYDIVVFQKLFDYKAIEKACSLKMHQGTKIIFDIGTNYLNLDSECVNQDQKDHCISMLHVADYITVSSPFLKDEYAKVHNDVHFINDAVEDRFLKYTKEHNGLGNAIKIVYCGYSNKVKELFLIKDVLKKLAQKYLIRMLYITDKDPGNIIGIPYSFVKFDYLGLPSQLRLGDIKVSPRDLSRQYNKGHSVIKIAYPMALNLPVVASPVPSYISYLQKRNICRTELEWYNSLEGLIQSVRVRVDTGNMNKDTVKKHLSLSVIGPKWKEFFIGI